MAGKWEFPGGKVQAGEQPLQALQRELKEELNIDVTSVRSFIQLRHAYPDKSIFLDVYKVYNFEGIENGNEGQQIKWVSGDDLRKYEFPQANRLILNSLFVPELIAITPDNVDPAMATPVKNVLANGIDVVLYRDYQSDNKRYLDNAYILNDNFSSQFARSSSEKKLGLMVSRPEVSLNKIESFCGLHLNSQDLKQFKSRPISHKKLLSASCHNIEEIRQAESVGCDFIYLAPVLKTASHQTAENLGWTMSESLVAQTALPVILLGGLALTDLEQAKSIGALGIAGISRFWN
jgi:8-oxo-dGTP diphosphatase